MEQELYRKQEAFTRYYAITDGDLLKQCTPGRIAMVLLRNICTDFGAAPSICYQNGEKMVTILFHDVSFSCLDFSGNYGELMAGLSSFWPMTVYGTADGRETCELICEREEKRVKVEQKTVSGKSRDILSDMCITVECDTKENAQALAVLAGAVTAAGDALVVTKQYELFCRNQQFSIKSEGSYFCYIRIDESADYSDFVRSLGMTQKAELWRVFLTYGVCPLEFEWLYQMYRENLPANLLEWELALRQELGKLSFKVVHEEMYFTVTDADHEERRFDFDSGSPAEKMFLKILFPLGGH